MLLALRHLFWRLVLRRLLYFWYLFRRKQLRMQWMHATIGVRKLRGFFPLLSELEHVLHWMRGGVLSERWELPGMHGHLKLRLPDVHFHRQQRLHCLRGGSLRFPGWPKLLPMHVRKLHY